MMDVLKHLHVLSYGSTVHDDNSFQMIQSQELINLHGSCSVNVLSLAFVAQRSVVELIICIV